MRTSFSKTGPNLLTFLEAGGVKTASCPTCQPGHQPSELGRPTPVRGTLRICLGHCCNWDPVRSWCMFVRCPKPSHFCPHASWVHLLLQSCCFEMRVKTLGKLKARSAIRELTPPTGSCKDTTPSDVIFLRFKCETQALEQAKPGKSHEKQVGDLLQTSSAAQKPFQGPAQADGRVHERFPSSS